MVVDVVASSGVKIPEMSSFSVQGVQSKVEMTEGRKGLGDAGMDYKCL